jgi:hypothetical protein
LGKKLLILAAYFGKHGTIGSPAVPRQPNFREIVPPLNRRKSAAFYRQPSLFPGNIACEPRPLRNKSYPFRWSKDNRGRYSRLFHILPLYMDREKIPERKIWLTSFLHWFPSSCLGTRL